MLRGSREFKRSVLEVAGHVASGRLVPTQGLQFLKRVQANVNVKLGEAEGQPEGAAQIKRFQEAVVDTMCTLYQQVCTNINTYDGRSDCFSQAAIYPCSGCNCTACVCV